MVALGRPNREQVITSRSAAATTLQALELSNGATLASVLERGAKKLLARRRARRIASIDLVYQRALGRAPTDAEMTLCRSLRRQRRANADRGGRRGFAVGGGDAARISVDGLRSARCC